MSEKIIWTDSKFEEYIKTLVNETSVDDSAAYDMAEGLLEYEVGLLAYIESKGIKDPIGYLADRIV